MHADSLSLSRRQFAAGAAGLTALTLAGRDAAAQIATPIATTEATRTFIDDRGAEIAVPADPQRVVTLDTPYLDLCLLLGITPVGGVSGRSLSTWSVVIEAIANGMVDLGSAPEIDLEVITSLKPDLIIGGVFNADRGHDQLAQIAPTFFAGQVNANWRERMAYAASMLGHEADWQILDDTYATDLEAARQNLPAEVQGAKISHVRAMPDALRYQTSKHFIGEVLDALGFDIVQGEDADDRTREISFEQIRDLDAEYLFLVIDGEPDENTLYQELITNDLWLQLEAVKQGHVYEVNAQAWLELRGYSAAYTVFEDLAAIFTQDAATPTA